MAPPSQRRGEPFNQLFRVNSGQTIPQPDNTPTSHLVPLDVHLHPHLIMSVLLQGLSALSAFSPKPATEEYEGLEYRWKVFTFRPAEFKLEAAIFIVVGAYLAWYFLGKSWNQTRATAT